jgi:hypothetical protein
LENLTPTVDWIEAVTGSRITIEHRNKTSPRLIDRIDVSAASVQFVQEFFAEDFEMFGYSESLPERFQQV